MTTKSTIAHHCVADVTDGQWCKQADEHRARMVITRGHWKESDPFFLLAADWYRPGVSCRRLEAGSWLLAD